jgi:hypothetical protein
VDSTEVVEAVVSTVADPPLVEAVGIVVVVVDMEMTAGGISHLYPDKIRRGDPIRDRLF